MTSIRAQQIQLFFVIPMIVSGISLMNGGSTQMAPLVTIVTFFLAFIVTSTVYDYGYRWDSAMLSLGLSFLVTLPTTLLFDSFVYFPILHEPTPTFTHNTEGIRQRVLPVEIVFNAFCFFAFLSFTGYWLWLRNKEAREAERQEREARKGQYEIGGFVRTHARGGVKIC